MRIVRWIGRSLAALALIVCVTFVLGLAGRDPALYPAAADRARWVAVVDHGWHVGIVVSAADLRAATIAIGRTDAETARLLRRLAATAPQAPFFEFGWGDAAVYRSTRRMEDLSSGLAFWALAWPTPSVLHVVPVHAPPVRSFAGSDQQALALSDAGFTALVSALAATFAPSAAMAPVDLGPGLYGEARFYAARPSYSALRTCNHWVAEMLRAGGVPASWSFSAFSGGLMAELAWRTDDLAP